MLDTTTPRLADEAVAAAIGRELGRQQHQIELIASENIVSRDVLIAQGSVLTNKYAEGYPGKRYYGGCEFVDEVETIAIDRVKQLFGAAYANVQPHSGAQANQAVFLALLQPGDRIMGMNLAHGGHLTHGMALNFSGRLYEVHAYGVRQDTERIDYDAMEAQAREVRPKLIVAGASAYSRTWEAKERQTVRWKRSSVSRVSTTCAVSKTVRAPEPTGIRARSRGQPVASRSRTAGPSRA